MHFPNISFISHFFLYSFLRGNDPDKKNVPYNMGTPCKDCPNDCEDRLCSKFYISVCVMMAVDPGAICTSNQAFNNIALF